MLSRLEEICQERLWLGWTEEQSLFYISGLTNEFINSWKPIKMVWSHE